MRARPGTRPSPALVNRHEAGQSLTQSITHPDGSPSGVRSPGHPVRAEKRKSTMPKNKTHSGAKKRFRVTGSGKLMREQTNKRHLLEVKSSRRKRRLAQDQSVAKADVRQVKKLLGR